MKKNIHPTWHHNAVVTCACGNSFTTGSTLDELKVDICSACHPFFTGEMKFVDRQGRVDKFRQKMAAAQKMQGKKKSKKKTDDNQAEPQSYKQLLQQQKQAMKQVAKQRMAA